MSEGDLIHKILPSYPPLARSARIQGQVVLQAVISKQGVIENLKVLAGHPMLVPAAIEAVRQWRYRPYFLNNEPVEVETQIIVNFSLAGS
jgi:protein TonB